MLHWTATVKVSSTAVEQWLKYFASSISEEVGPTYRKLGIKEPQQITVPHEQEAWRHSQIRCSFQFLRLKSPYFQGTGYKCVCVRLCEGAARSSDSALLQTKGVNPPSVGFSKFLPAEFSQVTLPTDFD